MIRILGVLLVGLLSVAGALGAAAQAEGATALRICGSGNGHGVGLSQYGAYGRAQAGQNYAQIIKAYYRGVSLARYGDNPRVRVLLGERALDGSHYVAVGPGSRARMKNLATGDAVPLAPATYRVQYLSTQRLYRVTNVSANEPVGSFTGPILFQRVSGDLLGHGGKSYRGALLAEASGSKFYLINRLRMESYIKGVVPNEMPSSWSLEALKSQAVAARSYAWATIQEGEFDFYADIRDQVYGGASSETPSTNAAVTATDRVVALYGGEPVVAYFYSANGGYTENGSYVFGPAPYLKSFRDVNSAGVRFEALGNSPWMRWSGTLDANGSPQLGVGAISGLRVLERSPSGRATKIEVTGTRGKKTISGQYNIRLGLKTSGIRRADGSSYPAGYLPSARISFGKACG